MHLARRALVALGVLTLTLLALGCDGGGSRRGDRYLDNPDDRTYANRLEKSYPAASGADLHFASFEGRFVWVDFAAPWCAPCAPQAQTIRQLEGNTPNVVFVTLMTDDQQPNSPATSATAASWAGRFGLDANHVAACEETRVIPSHMLFSPEGQLLYWKEGGHTASQIQAVLAQNVSRWNQRLQAGSDALYR